MFLSFIIISILSRFLNGGNEGINGRGREGGKERRGEGEEGGGREGRR